MCRSGMGERGRHPPDDRRGRIKSVRSRLSVNDLARLIARSSMPGRRTLPPRTATRSRWYRVVFPHRHRLPRPTPGAGHEEILGGRQVGIRVEPAVLMFFDLQTRELLRTDQLRRIEQIGGSATATRATATAVGRADPSAAPRLRQRGDPWSPVRRLPSAVPTSTRPSPCWCRDHPGGRVRRRRHPRRSAHRRQPVRSIKGHRPRTVRRFLGRLSSIT